MGKLAEATKKLYLDMYGSYPAWIDTEKGDSEDNYWLSECMKSDLMAGTLHPTILELFVPNKLLNKDENANNFLVGPLNISMDVYRWLKLLYKQELELKLTDIISLKEILDEPNSEKRRQLIVWVGISEFFKELVKTGQAEIILQPTGPDDYQNALLWQISYKDDLGEHLEKLLEVHNGTRVPYWEILTEQQKIDKGLTSDGRERFFLTVPADRNYKTMWEAWDTTFGFGDEDDAEFTKVTGIQKQDILRKFIEA